MTWARCFIEHNNGDAPRRARGADRESQWVAGAIETDDQINRV
jgi:hypothetical protein